MFGYWLKALKAAVSFGKNETETAYDRDAADLAYIKDIESGKDFGIAWKDHDDACRKLRR
jgi:hypothetical protein